MRLPSSLLRRNAVAATFAVVIRILNAQTPADLSAYSYGHVVHVIPFTHVDPGWKFTFDEHYRDVKQILKPVLLELLVGPSRSFAWEGSAYLTRWLEDFEHVNLNEFEARKPSRSSLPQLRPPWTHEEAQIIRQRIAEACSPDHGAIFLGTGSCQTSCPRFLDASFLGAKVQQMNGNASKDNGYDALICPSWSGLARYLVRAGQLDIVGGGWVSHDEALSSVRGIIHQLTLGRRSLLALGITGPATSTCSLTSNSSTISVAPSVSWQVDSFGLSASTAKLFKEFGYRGHVAARIPWNVKKKLTANRELDFTWDFGTPLSEDSACSGLLTTILDKHYSAPQGTDFKVSRPISRTSRTPARGAVKEVTSILGQELESRAANHRTPLQILPMGDDFRFLGSSAAYRHFMYLDAFLARASGEKSGDAGDTGSSSFGSQKWSVAYSSPSRYIAALSEFTRCNICRNDEQENLQIVRKWNSVLPSRQHDDFFPYSESFNNDWSGFFGSRPVLKNMIRKLEASQASSEAAFALARLHSEYSDDDFTKLLKCQRIFGCFNQRALQLSIKLGREASALLLHHDAITGTCRNYVARDYMRKGKAAHRAAEHVIRKSLRSLMGEGIAEGGTSNAPSEVNSRNNTEAEWRASQSRRQLEFHIFNSLATPRNRLVSLGTNFTCSDAWTVYGPWRSVPGCSHLRKSGGEYFPSQMSQSLLVEKLHSGGRRAFRPEGESCELLVEVPLAGLEAVSLMAVPVSSSFDGDEAYKYRAARSKEKLIDVGALHGSKDGVFSHEWAPFQSKKNEQWPLSNGTYDAAVPNSNVQGLRIAFSASPLASFRRNRLDYSISIQILYKVLGSESKQRDILSTQLREYKSANGLGPKLGWVGSGGAYVFRSILSALFGIAILAAAGYGIMLVIIISWQRRRRSHQWNKRAVHDSEPTTHPSMPVVDKDYCNLNKLRYIRRRAIVVLLLSACFGYWLAHETLRGRYDWLIFERSHLIAESLPKAIPTTFGRNYRGDDDEDLLGLNAPKTSSYSSDTFQTESLSDDAKFLMGALFLSPSAAIITALAFAAAGNAGGIGALPCAAFTFALTCILSPDYQSRPLSGSLGAKGVESLSLLLSEGPLSSSMYYAVGKGEHRSVQAFVVGRSDWLQMNVIEMVTSVTAPVGHEVVARLYSSSIATSSWIDRVWTTFRQLFGLISICEMTTDDGLLHSQPIRFSPWISLSATFHPIRSLMIVSCTANSRSSFTLIPFAPTGARVTSSPGGAEVMLHRSLAVDDEKGLGEPLLDQSRAKLHHLLALGPLYMREFTDTFEVNTRHLAVSFSNPIYALNVEKTSNYSYSKPSVYSWQGLRTGFVLPKSVSLLSLQWWQISADFPPSASMMKSVCHKMARKVLFLRFQQLDIASVNRQNVAFDEVDLNQMFRTPRGLWLCSVRETFLDFLPKVLAHESALNGDTSVTLSRKGARILRLSPGDLRAVVLSFCETTRT